ncbi:hypothetical protein ACLM5J_01495 [Nocardioides sp. Bht2]|uniref:hypothetical protein n=1 Tax=Nocardioides sp. Bht2 TaxID=3392297 RepID=UPI0039B6349F
MQNSPRGTTLREPMPIHPTLAGLVQLYPGASYRTDSASLALALLAGPSREGQWVAAIGVDDFGAEAAAELGIDLSRTLLVPDPGGHWPEVTAALLDVTSVLLLRPPAQVDAHTASRISARLRKRSAALVVQGAWPQCEAYLSIERQQWQGVGHGNGYLRSRRLMLGVQRGSGPGRTSTVNLPGTPLPATPRVLPAAPAALLREVG